MYTIHVGTMRVFFILAFAFALSVGFQNCARTDIDAQSIEKSSSSTNIVGSGNGQGYDGLNSGNGQGYDGKLTYSGDYYRWQPNYTCNLAGTPTGSWYEKITFDASGTGTVSGDLCGNPAPSLPPPSPQMPPNPIISPYETEVFAFLPNVISYKTNLFEKSSPPMMPAQGLPYLYCRTGMVYDSQFIDGTLVIVRRSVGQPQTYSAEIYWGKPNPSGPGNSYLAYSVPNFSVSSNLVPNVSETLSRPDFTLNVDYTSVSLGQKKYFGSGQFIYAYSASLSSIVNGAPFNLNLLCFKEFAPAMP